MQQISKTPCIERYVDMQIRDRQETSLVETLRRRRQALADQIQFPVILWSGRCPSRNFPSNTYPFRASSHFLYFAGVSLENVAIRLEQGRMDLFMDNPTATDALWHGFSPTRDEIARQIGADAAYPLSLLARYAEGAATIPVQDPGTRATQAQVLNRPMASRKRLLDGDRALAEAIIHLRLQHDEGAITEMLKAAAVTVQAHRVGMSSTRRASSEAEVRAAMEQVILAHDMEPAYRSIVTTHGEVLHNTVYRQELRTNELLLADVGAETPSGWASDVTRTWPVSGTFSGTQRDVYDVVLAAHDLCIQHLQPGVEYREIHLMAATVIAAGLVDLGILWGRAEDLVEHDVHALFFPHGIGHLLGLDVHDMEDLGDLAGYAPDRTRSDRFGLGYLRLDRPLLPGMVVTIEPGFYQVPAILNDPSRRADVEGWVNWERLNQFSDVRGIRIENDIRITESGADVMTSDLPTHPEAIEHLVS
jgi:Xaa-Pro aminopeptidase